MTHAAVAPGVALALLLACPSPGTAAAEAAPRVVASIQPIHSLVAGVMEGVGSPGLLVGSGASGTCNAPFYLAPAMQPAEATS